MDDFPKFSDPSSSDLPLIRQYETLYNADKIQEANTILDANPQLKTMIISASNLNNVRDAIIAIERWYKYQYQDYLTKTTKQIITSSAKPTGQIKGDVWDEVLI